MSLKHIRFMVNEEHLTGTIHLPERDMHEVGLVLLHGWAGYRIGAHQMFVKLAKAAQVCGFACLRFDFRGRGDSEGKASDTTLNMMIEDACVAAELLMQEVGVKQICFIGDCSGSEVAIGAGILTKYCTAMVLWSAPIVAGSREKTAGAKRKFILQQYVKKFFRPETWSKFFSGSLNWQGILKAMSRGGKGAGEEGSQADARIDWHERFVKFKGDVLFIYGSKDPTAEAGLAHYETLSKKAQREFYSYLVQGANHAFYSVRWEDEVISQTLNWIDNRQNEAS